MAAEAHVELHSVGLVYRAQAWMVRVLLQNKEPEALAIGEARLDPVAHNRGDLGRDGLAVEGLLQTVEQVVLDHTPVAGVPLVVGLVRIAVAAVLVRIAVVPGDLVPPCPDRVEVVRPWVAYRVVLACPDQAVVVRPLVAYRVVLACPDQAEVVRPLVAYQEAVDHQVDRRDPDVAVSSDHQVRRVPEVLKLQVPSLDFEQNS